MYLDESIEKIKNLDAFEDWEFQGCSDQDIRALEQELPDNLKLPGAYLEFLQFCGHGLGLFLQGDNFFYSHILRMQKKGELEKLMKSDRYYGSLKETFAADMFMIYQHHGGEFVRFIKLTEGDNPAVYYFEDAINFTGYHIQEDSFSEYFLFEIEKYIQLHRIIVLDSPQVLQDKITSYKKRLHQLVTVFTSLNEQYHRPINSYLLKRYSRALEDIYTLFMTYTQFSESDFLISATTKFLAENQDLPEKEIIAQQMEEAKELIQEIFSLISE